MICPFCSHMNIPGDDECAECGQSLVDMEEQGSVIIRAITTDTIDEIELRDPIVIDPFTTLRNAIQKMIDGHLGCLMVVEADQLVGVITERDVLNKITDDLSNLDEPVRDYMTADPMTIISQDSIAYALHAMDLGGYRHLPILDQNERPAGIVSVRDILRFLCNRFSDVSVAS